MTFMILENATLVVVSKRSTSQSWNVLSCICWKSLVVTNSLKKIENRGNVSSTSWLLTWEWQWNRHKYKDLGAWNAGVQLTNIHLLWAHPNCISEETRKKSMYVSNALTVVFIEEQLHQLSSRLAKLVKYRTFNYTTNRNIFHIRLALDAMHMVNILQNIC